MSERDLILIALIREVLGPRHGPHEILPENQDPRDEYITGVLAPARALRSPDEIEADIDEVIEETSSEDDQVTQGYVVVPGVFSPALDPKSLPRSIGLSFTVQASDGPPQIEVCATWARYQPHQDGWQRQPAAFLTGPVRADQNQVWIAAEGVRLQLRSRSLPDSSWRISLFLVNVTEVTGDGRLATSDHIFQPQMRVSCCPGTSLVPVWTVGASNLLDSPSDSLAAEDASLALLYRERTALARGHLCGAIWRTIDPERPHPTLPSLGEAPFAWTDAVMAPESERAKFSPADVRTELVPCYPIEAPHMNWDEQFGPPPVLDPQILSETWQPEQVRDRLQPLVEGYQAWIQGQQLLVASLPSGQRPVAETHLHQCRQAADRIQQAIETLATDEDARLAFCFANKAIALQSRWTRGQVLTWRPFQLAFILLNVPALADPFHPDRRTCDLLWFPTGGGKTEAYLGLAAFTLALRRRRARRNRDRDGDRTGAGVGVLSRYTLRLLTIQQFRRALGVITACEMLRVWGLDSPPGPVGWRPHGCSNHESFLWGGLRFSAGLWVGGGVAPNNLLSIGPVPGPDGLTFYVGALDILQGASREYDGPNQALQRNIRASRHLEIGGEPAQVLSCPCCRAILTVPDEGLGPGQHTLHFIFQGGRTTTPPLTQFLPAGSGLSIDAATLTPHAAPGYRTLSLTFTIPDERSLSARQVDEWWYQTIASALGQQVRLLSAHPARPGYFINTYDNSQNNARQCDFDIYCPNPECELNQHVWAEQVPLSRASRSAPSSSGSGQLSLGVMATEQTAELPATPDMQWEEVPEWCRRGKTKWVSNRIPIPANTVDDQIYHRCPSLVIATVDKFARLAFEPKAAALFGNVDHYHSRWGYYREGCPPSSSGNLPSGYQPHPPGRSRGNPLHMPVAAFAPPDLILQDELHLIEGPLGSMVGLYETAIDPLCQRQQDGQAIVPKYIASTATVRQAEPQVQAIFDRRLAQFPPWATSADDRFFARDQEIHPQESDRPGRLYVAICAPGKGAQTPIVRIWSALLQSTYERWQANQTPEVDRFWTLVGYFNAIRELAGALSLFRQDIPERITFQTGTGARPLDRWLELSSRASSLDLPALLERLTISAPEALDAVFATSMFGTGVDVDRLNLMVVHGQPKTTASYIQATGRVGRQGGGLVVTFFRASRPRDLDHYEFFTGYHRALYRHVEPITVAPFSPRARERGLGPLAVILLRHATELDGQPVSLEWRVQQRVSGGYFAQAHWMGPHRHDPEVTVIPDLLERRAGQQPTGRRPPAGVTAQEAASELDRWAALAGLNPDPDRFVYSEPAVLRPPERHVVLGDAQHRAQGLSEAYENAPQSLREVEETTGFKS
ncbi:MAG: DISARM system helicase DrmA [Anaerolineae bacterium]